MRPVNHLPKCTYAILSIRTSSHLSAARGLRQPIAGQGAHGGGSERQRSFAATAPVGLSQRLQASVLRRSSVCVSVTTAEGCVGRVGSLGRSRTAPALGLERVPRWRQQLMPFSPRSHVGPASRSALLDTPSDALRRRAIVTGLTFLGQVRAGEHAAVAGVCVRKSDGARSSDVPPIALDGMGRAEGGQ